MIEPPCGKPYPRFYGVFRRPWEVHWVAFLGEDEDGIQSKEELGEFPTAAMAARVRDIATLKLHTANTSQATTPRSIRERKNNNDTSKSMPTLNFPFTDYNGWLDECTDIPWVTFLQSLELISQRGEDWAHGWARSPRYRGIVQGNGDLRPTSSSHEDGWHALYAFDDPDHPTSTRTASRKPTIPNDSLT